LISFVLALGLPALAEEVSEGEGQGEQEDDTTHTPVRQHTDYDEIVVTASPHARRRFDVIQGTTILSEEALEQSIQSTLGETIAELPGVSSTYFGPGASRPVIRGLDGPRVRVLQNGIGTLDASVTSPDHAVVADPLAANRIEIIRGAGTLLYGSSAIGGVVNVDDGRIPIELPGDVADGDVRVLYGSAAQEKSAGAGVTTALGPVAFRASGFFRASEDLSIPGFAISQELKRARPDTPLGPHGVALDTDTESKGGTIGTSLIGELGMVGVSFGIDDSQYGVPAEPGERVRIDLQQTRVDVRAELDREWLIFERTDFRFGFADYEHTEIEGGLTGTVFDNTGYEGRVVLVQQPWKDLHGSVGFHFGVRDFEAVGEEVFTPPNRSWSWALFGVEEYHLGPVTLEAGLRFEQQNTELAQLPLGRTFDMISFSAGAGWSPAPDYLFGITLSRTERAPSPEELLSNGPHLATAGFDVGNPFFGKEAGLTIELTARKRRGRWSGGVNFYYTRFDDFIYLQNRGFVDETGSPDPMGELMLRTYQQADAEFIGGEVQAAVDVIRHERFTGVIDGALDWVTGTVQNPTSDRLPRIPPLRLKGGIEARSELADLRFELWWVREQLRTAAWELPTDDYLMLNLIFTAHPFPDARNVTLIVQGRNLTNAEARVHSSFLKDRLPLPGREARVGMRVAF
jgi:iron complex outermembrane receptor protein